MEYVASLQSFLRGFAAPFAGPSFTAATPSDVAPIADSEPHKICVVTQNVWCHYAATPGDELKCRFGKKERYGVNKDVMSGFDVTSRLQAIANAVREQGADILLVQELFLFRVSPLVTLSHNFITFQQMMRNIGLIYHTTPTLSCTFVGQNSGLAVFSRFPIVRESFETFVASHEKLNNKGVIGALVQIAPGKQLAVVCTHLDSHASNPVRFSQMQQVSNMVDELRRTAGGATAVVVGGDFNVCPQTVEQGGYDDGTQFRQLQTIMGSAALQPLFDDVRAMPLTIENTTLDHIFYSGMRVPASAEGTTDDDTKRKAPREILRAADVLTGHAASDHFGLVARFEV